MRRRYPIAPAAASPSLKALLGTLFVILLLSLATRPVTAQEDGVALDYELSRLELHLRINGDGTLNVVESQRVTVTAGSLLSGFQNLSLRQIDRVEEMTVEANGRVLNLDESGCSLCYWTIVQPRGSDWVYYDQESFELVFNPEAMGQVQTFWDFPGIEAGQSAEFVLRYTVVGALQLFEGSQRIIWDVTPGFAVPVDEALVFITPPPGTVPEDLTIEAGPAGSEIDEFGRLVLTYEGAVPADDHWFVNITLPAGATSASRSAWQQELETVVQAAEAAQAEARFSEQEQYLQEARQRFLALGFTILILVGGSILIYRQRQRSAPSSLPLGGLSPSALPFILAGEVDNAGARALLTQLAILLDYGLIKLGRAPGSEEFMLTKEAQPLRERRHWTLPDGAEIRLAPAVVTTFKALPAGHYGEAGLKEALADKLGAIIEDMVADVAELIGATPRRLRELRLRGGLVTLVIGIITVLGTALAGYGRLGWIAFGPGFAFLVVGAIVYYMARNDTAADEVPLLSQQIKAYRSQLQKEIKGAEPDELAHLLEQEVAYIIGFAELPALLAAAEKEGLPGTRQLQGLEERLLPLCQELLERPVKETTGRRLLAKEMAEALAELE